MIDLTKLSPGASRPQPTATAAPGEEIAAPAGRPAEAYVLSRADTAECTCPEFCERDHANE